MARYDDNNSEFEENVISIDRVARVVKGGRRFRFRALVVVGDGKTRVGIGIAKGSDVQRSIQKAVEKAKRNMVTIAIKGETIPHEVQARQTGAIVLLKPAAPGTGKKAGGTVRAVLDVTGINNILTKSLGSNNKLNVAYATLKALEQLTPESEWVTTRDEPKAKSKKPAAKTKKSKAKKSTKSTKTTKKSSKTTTKKAKK